MVYTFVGGVVRAHTFLVLVVVAGCNKSSASHEDGAAASASAATPSATTSTSAPLRAARKVPTPLEVVNAWNDAHTKHDAKALASLYAPNVTFYGRTLTNAQCVAAKKAAFAKSPDYAQSIRDVVVAEAGVVTFTKTSTSGGKSTDYPAVLVVTNGLVSAETDKVTEANLVAQTAEKGKWCEKGDAIIAPYRISANEAQERVRRSKYFLETQSWNNPRLGADEVVCPTKCDRDAFQCGYSIALVAYGHETSDPLSMPTRNLLEWLYVDAVDATLWYEQGSDGKWQHSERLPPLSDD